jgi:opacity protein-like surface antigen
MSCLLAVCATTAFAQTAVRVTRDQTTIWNPGFSIEAVVVPAGTVLTVVARRGDWYEVHVPGERRAGDSPTGFIYKGNVVAVKESASPRQTGADELSSERTRPVGVFGFVQGGYTWFAARNSFQAVLDRPGGPLLGGGGEVRVRGRLFVNASVERFEQQGERVFVFDGEVFRLGTPNTITMVPFVMTAGWRFEHARVTPYAGAGIGRMSYKERSSVADPGEDVDTRFTTYHALGGVEFRENWVATAFEVQYSSVPDALGLAGASAAFGESNLGGFGARIKIVVGR